MMIDEQTSKAVMRLTSVIDEAVNKPMQNNVVDYSRGFDTWEDLEAIPDPEVLCKSDNGMALAYRRSLTIISAVDGVGKSALVALMVSALPFERVLWIDSEQEAPARKKMFHKLATLRGFASLSDLGESIKPFSLLDNFDVEDYVNAIKFAVEAYKPSVVVLDNIADAVLDSSSKDEARTMINEVISRYIIKEHEASVIGIIHNARTTGEIEGFVGSVARQKTTTALHLTANEFGGVTIEYRKHRHGRKTDKASFVFDDKGVPHWESENEGQISAKVVEATKTSRRNEIAKIFGSDSILSASELAQRLGLGKTQCHEWINACIGLGLLTKAKRGYYEAVKLSSDDETELSPR